MLRGGFGIYYGDALSADANWMYGNTQIATIQIKRRPGGLRDQSVQRRPLPTYDEAQTVLSREPAPGCLIAAAQELAPPAEFTRVAHRGRAPSASSVSSRDDMAFEADYVFTGRARETRPAEHQSHLRSGTGEPPFSDRASVPYPRLWCRVDELPPGAVELPRPADGVHQAVPQPLAGVGTYTLSTL